MRVTQVGCCRLAQLIMPISGKPGIGGWRRARSMRPSFETLAALAPQDEALLPAPTGNRLVSLAVAFADRIVILVVELFVKYRREDDREAVVEMPRPLLQAYHLAGRRERVPQQRAGAVFAPFVDILL